ncbi:GtrA family protein [Planosporangium flavigriseum]|uniref:GtrA family protein n=1 Tax=Planosporangium flavigriseum TaxID=373681 RepID=UPI001EF2E4E0|nr:GtrA family protein [Planosporangium flavigriseum]
MSRFSLVGVIGIVVNNIVLFALHGLLGLALVPATVAAVEVAMVHNYLLHEVWTFRHRRPSARRFISYSLVAAAALLVNVSIVGVLAGVGLYYLLANLVGIGAAFAINFAVSSTWIWSERTDGAHSAGRHSSRLADADDSGSARSLLDDLHLGPAGGGHAGPGARRARRPAAVLYRHRAGAARGGSHPADYRPRRSH